MTRRAPRYTFQDGFRMPMGFPAEMFSSGLRYRPGAGDLFLATYPKCGTTWVQHIIHLILHRGEPLPPQSSISDTFPHLEEVGGDAVAALPPPRLIKTHLPLAMTPYSADARYICVARNPFDCAVSFYHHTRGFVQHYDFADGTFDEFFECFIAGEVDFGDYFDHLIPWCERQRDRNVLFLTYEGLKAHTETGLAGIAAFIGPDAAATLREPGVLPRVLEHSSFEAMRRDQHRWSSARPPGMPEFVRRGIVGDWMNHFSAAQARRLAAKFDERTRGTAAARLWPDVLEAARNLP